MNLLAALNLGEMQATAAAVRDRPNLLALPIHVLQGLPSSQYLADASLVAGADASPQVLGDASPQVLGDASQPGPHDKSLLQQRDASPAHAMDFSDSGLSPAWQRAIEHVFQEVRDERTAAVPPAPPPTVQPQYAPAPPMLPMPPVPPAPPMPPRPSLQLQQASEYRLAVLGDRSWSDYRALSRELDLVTQRIRRDHPGARIVILSGDDRGACQHTRVYARQHNFAFVDMRPDWNTHGKAAAYKRNAALLTAAHELVAFWDGVTRETGQPIEVARQRKLPVTICGAGAANQQVKLPAPPAARGRGPNDVTRILELPVVDVADVPDLTEQFMRPGIQRHELKPGPLLPIQSQALYWAGQMGGLVGAMGVGAGKTLATFLLPAMLKSTVSILLVPPNLYKKTCKAYKALRLYWRLPALGDWSNPVVPDAPGQLLSTNDPLLYIISLGQLSTSTNSDLLDRIQADCVIVDEAHALRGSNSARSRRFKRYFEANPDTRGCFLSGTITNAAITDYWHLCAWALKDRSPLPTSFHVAEVFDAAFGAKSDEERYAQAASSGREAPALGYVEDVRARYMRWASAQAGADVTDHLDAYRRRISTAAGFVATSSGGVSASLIVVERTEPAMPPAVKAAVSKLEETWCTPSGEEIESQLVFEHAARTLSSGFYNEWLWPNGPDKEWLEARRNWHRAVRQFLKRNIEKLDSPMLVEAACKRKDDRVCKFQVALDAEQLATMATVYEAWAQVKHRPEPGTRAIWIDKWLCHDAVALAKTMTSAPPIIWYESPAVGDVLEDISGFERFGPGDSDSRKIVELAQRVLEGKEKARPIIASILCHGTGKDLQGWSNAIVVQCPSNGSVLEQLLGREHRLGQLADEVTYHIYVHSPWAQDALAKARTECEYQERTIGSPQKILLAETIAQEDWT